MDIVVALDKKKKLFHGELAKEVCTSAASLSNILVKFDEFEYKLIGSESEGKFRYYYLTELCKKYLACCNQESVTQETVKIVQHEILQIKQQIKNALKGFQEIYEDGWELELEDALINRIECRKTIDNEAEQLVDIFVIGAEKLLLYNYDDHSVMILQMLSQNSILQGRITRLWEHCEAFRPILEAWDNEDYVQVYDQLSSIIESCRQKKGTAQENKLFSEIDRILKQVEKYEQRDIIRCFMWYMAGNKALSAFIAQLISKDQKEKCIYDFTK